MQTYTDATPTTLPLDTLLTVYDVASNDAARPLGDREAVLAVGHPGVSSQRVQRDVQGRYPEFASMLREWHDDILPTLNL